MTQPSHTNPELKGVMSNKVKPEQKVIDYFSQLGFEYDVITESIYRDKRDVPIHFFQTDSKNHSQDCSTIMAADAVRIFNSLSEHHND